MPSSTPFMSNWYFQHTIYVRLILPAFHLCQIDTSSIHLCQIDTSSIPFMSNWYFKFFFFFFNFFTIFFFLFFFPTHICRIIIPLFNLYFFFFFCNELRTSSWHNCLLGVLIGTLRSPTLHWIKTFTLPVCPTSLPYLRQSPRL